jgi:hypothetical protein
MAKKEELLKLLIQARDFDNETVRNSGAMAVWRRKLDKALEGEPGDDPAARYDAPSRRDHRQFVQNVFHGPGSRL